MVGSPPAGPIHRVSVPIKVRLVGRPTDADLDRLSATVSRAVARRLALAHRTLSTTARKSPPARHPKVRLHDAGHLRLKGAETGASVDRFLAEVRRRISVLGHAQLGRITGNFLQFGEHEYELRSPDVWEGLTVSGDIGEGAFYLSPVPNQRAGLLQLIQGSAYEILRVREDGDFTRTGLTVWAVGLGPISEGILAYAPKRIIAAEVRVEARKPRDTGRLAGEIVKILEQIGTQFAPGLTVLRVKQLLVPEALTRDEMHDVLERLDSLGRLGEFLNLVRLPEFRAFLRDLGIAWYYILEHWEPSFNDSGLFFTGFLIGAGENVYDCLKLVAILIGGPFSEELGRERHEMWEGVKTFFAHPVVNSIEGLKHLYKAFEDSLNDLDFFEAGRMMGNLVVLILTLPEAIRALPKAARSLAKVAVLITRVGLRAVEEIGVQLAQLAEMVRGLKPRLVTPEGFVLMEAGEDILVVDQAGKPVGKLSKAEALKALRDEKLLSEAEIREWEEGARNQIEAWEQPKAGEPPEPQFVKPPIPPLEELMRLAMRRVKRLFSGGMGPSLYGNRLHTQLRRIIAEFGNADDWLIAADRPIREIIKLPREIAEMTVDEWLTTRHPELSGLRETLTPELLNTEIGNLEPDLVLKPPGEAQAVVWDLTSELKDPHFGKTSLYAHVLSLEGDLKLVSIGETYWRPPVPSPAALAPLTGAAAKGVKGASKRWR